MEGWPVPTLMVAGGAALGILLAVTAKFITAGVAKRRGARARKRLNAAVADVADRLVVEPVEAEVRRLEAFNAALRTAAG